MPCPVPAGPATWQNADRDTNLATSMSSGPAAMAPIGDQTCGATPACIDLANAQPGEAGRGERPRAGQHRVPGPANTAPMGRTGHSAVC